MTSIVVLIATIAVACALRNPIKKWPVAFYAIAVALVIVYFALPSLGAPRAVNLAFYWAIRKCLAPLALFIVVMYIGVFPVTSGVSRWLRPIRAELSIIAWILTLGHVVQYLTNYLKPIFSGVALQANVLIGIIVAIVLFVLLIVLGVTSFQFVKKRMTAESWKNVQRLAYPFFGLTYVHLLCLLLPSAVRGGIAARLSVAVYSVIFIAYAVLRISRAVIDKREGEA
jgi:sulfoxide reductase heme-binding subunit YedZ